MARRGRVVVFGSLAWAVSATSGLNLEGRPSQPTPTRTRRLLGRLRETNRRRAVALGRLLAEHPTLPRTQEFHERVQTLPTTPALPPVEPPSTT